MAKINDENASALSFRHKSGVPDALLSTKRNAFKIQCTPGTVKKQAFGELHNVMHASTPADKYSSAFRPTVTVCNDAFRKQRQNIVGDQQAKSVKRNQYLLANSLSMEDEEEQEQENLFDYFDFGSCTKNCQKTDQQLWSEMNLIDDAVLDKIMAGGDPDFNVEYDSQDITPFSRSDDVDITAVLNFPVDDEYIPLQELPPEFIDMNEDCNPYII